MPALAGQFGVLVLLAGPRIQSEQAADLIRTGIISGGMIPKVQACVSALEHIERAHIIDGRREHALIYELFTDSGVGTMLTRG